MQGQSAEKKKPENSAQNESAAGSTAKRAEEKMAQGYPHSDEKADPHILTNTSMV